MRLRKIFFPNMFFYHFLQLCPRGHISKMLAVTVIKNTVTKRLWNFQIRFLPYSNTFEKNFFFPNMFFYHFLQLCPRGHISKNACCNRIMKNTVPKALSNRVFDNGYSKHFRDYDLGDKVEKNDKRTSAFGKKIFSQTYSNKAENGFENSKGA